MKILVPTDFTDTSQYALDFAVLLAKETKGEIHLYHSANIPDDWEDRSAKERYEDHENKSIALEARDRFEKIKAALTEKGITCEYHYTGGKYEDNISEITDKIDFDLLVLGSKGLVGMNDWFKKSNAQKVIRRLHVNAIIVKKPLAEINFKDVLFVSSLNVEDQEALRRFLNFAKHFDIENFHIMAVNTAGYFSQPTFLMKEVLKDFEKIADGFNVQTHFYTDFSVEAGIRHFGEENGIDLIAISNHVKHPLKRLFQGSNVENVVNHSDVPVFSIDY